MHKLLTSCLGRKGGLEADANKAPQCSLAAILPSQCSRKSKPNWGFPFSETAPFLEAAPFSMAVVTSDAKEVLFAKHGLEPTAAQLLEQALLFKSTSHSVNVPLAQQGGAFSEHGGSTGSFLTALLGPGLEAVAVQRARQDRWWKGTISVQLPGQDATPLLNDPIGCGCAPPHLLPPKTELHLGDPAPGSPASSHEPASLQSKLALVPEHMSTECVLHECNPSAAAPVARRGSAPGVLRSASPWGSRRPSGILVPGTKPSIKPPSSSGASSLRQDDSSKRVQWVCPEVDPTGAMSMSSPFKQVSEDVTASPEPTRSRSSNYRSLSSHGSLHNPLLSVPVSGSELASLTLALKAKSCPPVQDCTLVEKKEGAGDGQEPGEKEEGAEKLDNKAFLSRASCRSSRLGGKQARSVLNPPPSLTGRASHRRFLLTPEIAIEQLEQSGSCPEEYATRTVALLKSISQKRVSEDMSCQLLSQSVSAPPTQHQGSVSDGQPAMLSHISSPAAPSHKPRTSHTSAPPSAHSDKPADAPAVEPHSTATWCPLSNAHGSPQAVVPQVSPPWTPFSTAADPSVDAKPRSAGPVGNSDHNVEGTHAQCQHAATDPAELRAYVRKPSIVRISQRSSSSMVQNLEAPLEDGSQTDSADLLSMTTILKTGSSSQLCARHPSLTHTLKPDKEQHQLHSEASFHVHVPQSTWLTQGYEKRTSEPIPEEEGKLPTQSFDVLVSTLSEDARSPLLVSIFNCTEHMQVKATLTALAESQLELLSSCMPQHAIQFLAMESTEAVPEHVGQLARAHQDVTILFMDVVEFTSFSKNVKPVEVMVFLNKLFSLFDRLTDVHGVHKVETAGDCYIVAGGVMSPTQSSNGFRCVAEDHDPAESAKQVMDFAKALLEAAKQVNMPDTNEPVRVRVGLHTGDVVSGLIGSKMPKFSVFGDTMNTASRMESTGVPGRIHVSETTQKLLQTSEQWESTGGLEVKGKGQMQTYLWVPAVSHEQQQVRRTLAGTSEPLPCLFIKQAHTLLKHLGTPVPTLSAPAERLEIKAATRAAGCKERKSDPPCLSLAASVCRG